MTKEELAAFKQETQSRYDELKSRGLKIDMSRGKPGPVQLDMVQKDFKKAFESEAARKFFNTDELVKMLDVHKSGKLDNSKKIWVVYMFLIWYGVYFVQEKTTFA